MERGARSWRSCRCCSGAGRCPAWSRFPACAAIDADRAHAHRRRGQCRALLPYLRSQDAGLRAAAIEALQAMPEAVRIHDLAVLRTAIPTCASWPPSWRATCRRRKPPTCCAVCWSDSIPMSAPPRSRCWRKWGREAIPALEACAGRFAGTPFLPFAVSIAIARISNTES